MAAAWGLSMDDVRDMTRTETAAMDQAYRELARAHERAQKRAKP